MIEFKNNFDDFICKISINKIVLFCSTLVINYNKKCLKKRENVAFL
jgi:hypothetical protein